MQREALIRALHILLAKAHLYLAGEGTLTQGEIELMAMIDEFMQRRRI
jgi:hypothetical protein